MFIKAGENRKNRTVMKMPESQNTEWKSKWKDEYLEWICGYANAVSYTHLTLPTIA